MLAIIERQHEGEWIITVSRNCIKDNKWIILKLLDRWYSRAFNKTKVSLYLKTKK